MAELKEVPEWWMPRAWPLVWRRIFLLTLPISGPLWVALVVAGALATFALVLVVGVPIMALSILKEELWDERPDGKEQS